MFDKQLPIINALLALRPNAVWALHGEDATTLEWLDTTQTQPTVDEINAKVTAMAAAPQVVTPRQIRLALSQIGSRQQVEDYVNTATIDVQDSWHYSTQFERDHPMVLACKQLLNKTDSDLDALFVLAASL